MEIAACSVPVSPLRKEASHRSEMVSQLLFGERCMIVDRAPDHWLKVRCAYDDYEGWCQEAQVQPVSESSYKEALTFLSSSVATASTFGGQTMLLPMGCDLTLVKEGKIFSKDFALNGENWDTRQAVLNDKNLLNIAFQFMNTGYLWGGKSNFGIDCSGFTQTVFKFFNVRLQRDAYQQAAQGEGIGFLQEAKCGDLAFFDNAEGRITHVGILLNDAEIIHASTKVRVDKIDSQGILNRDTSLRTHKLRLIKRYF